MKSRGMEAKKETCGPHRVQCWSWEVLVIPGRKLLLIYLELLALYCCTQILSDVMKFDEREPKSASTLCRSRMQHITTLVLGKSCSAYAAKLITSTLKKNFLPTVFQFTKTVEWETRTQHMLCQKLCLAIVDGKYRHGKPLLRPILRRSNFHAVQHSTTCCGMQKLRQNHTTLMSTLTICGKVAYCCI